MTPAIDAILFDADGVVQTTDDRWFFALTGLIATDDREQVERFFGDIVVAELPSLAGHAPFGAALQEVLTRWRVTTPAVEVLDLWHHIDVNPTAVAAIQDLRSGGTRCALATNQHPERAAYMRTNLGFDRVFDDLFFSCEVGVAKPDPAFFREAARRLGTAPDRILLLDDNQQNVAGAEEAGLRAELFATGGSRSELDRSLAAYART